MANSYKLYQSVRITLKLKLLPKDVVIIGHCLIKTGAFGMIGLPQLAKPIHANAGRVIFKLIKWATLPWEFEYPELTNQSLRRLLADIGETADFWVYKCNL